MPVSIPLPGSVPASSAALLVSGDSHPFALVGKWAGGGAICGSEPGGCATLGPNRAPSVDHPPTNVVGGGWFGVLGYQLGREVERIGDPPPRPVPAPSSLMRFYDHVLRC